jgi:hypothetical protein
MADKIASKIANKIASKIVSKILQESKKQERFKQTTEIQPLLKNKGAAD